MGTLPTQILFLVLITALISSILSFLFVTISELCYGNRIKESMLGIVFAIFSIIILLILSHIVLVDVIEAFIYIMRIFSKKIV